MAGFSNSPVDVNTMAADSIQWQALVTVLLAFFLS
jgi:hypothetical protein